MEFSAISPYNARLHLHACKKAAQHNDQNTATTKQKLVDESVTLENVNVSDEDASDEPEETSPFEAAEVTMDSSSDEGDVQRLDPTTGMFV